MNGSPTFRARRVLEMAEKVREANGLITRALHQMEPDPPVRTPLRNAGRALGSRRELGDSI
jgi:hypothetical protein